MVLANELGQLSGNFDTPDTDGGGVFFNNFRHTLKIMPLPTSIDTTNIGHAFILGHATNGILNTTGVIASGIDGSALTLADSGWGATTTSRVQNTNNTYREYLRTNRFVDTDVTTATVDTTTYKITF